MKPSILTIKVKRVRGGYHYDSKAQHPGNEDLTWDLVDTLDQLLSEINGTVREWDRKATATVEANCG